MSAVNAIAAARELLYARSGWVCEICGRARGSNAQHRKNRSQGGLWALSNLIHVCGTGTTLCHGFIHANPTKSYSYGWSVRRSMDPRDMPALLRGGFGQAFMWLRDDGSKDEVEMADVAVAALLGKDGK